MRRPQMPLSPWPWNWKWHRRVLLKEWRHNAWEKASPLILALVVLAAGVIVVNREIQTSHYAALAAQYGKQIQTLTKEQITASNRHHDQNVLSQSEIKSAEQVIIAAQQDHAMTLDEIDALQKEVATVIEGLPAADKYLGEVAVDLEKQILAVCAATNSACPPLNLQHP